MTAQASCQAGGLQAKAQQMPGVLVDFGAGASYLVPPLALGDLEMLQERIGAIEGAPITSSASVATIIDATHKALCRNYICTRDQAAQLLDVGNMVSVFEAVMDVSALRRRAQAAGNVEAPPSTGTAGAASTPGSLPTPAGV